MHLEANLPPLSHSSKPQLVQVWKAQAQFLSPSLSLPLFHLQVTPVLYMWYTLEEIDCQNQIVCETVEYHYLSCDYVIGK